MYARGRKYSCNVHYVPCFLVACCTGLVCDGTTCCTCNGGEKRNGSCDVLPFFFVRNLHLNTYASILDFGCSATCNWLMSVLQDGYFSDGSGHGASVSDVIHRIAELLKKFFGQNEWGAPSFVIWAVDNEFQAIIDVSFPKA